MGTIAQEAAFQMALSSCSKVGGRSGRKVNIYVILVKGEVHAPKHTFCRSLLLVS